MIPACTFAANPQLKAPCKAASVRPQTSLKDSPKPWNKNRSSAKLAISVFMRLKSSNLCL